MLRESDPKGRAARFWGGLARRWLVLALPGLVLAGAAVAPFEAAAGARQPVVLSAVCPGGDAAGERLLEEGLDFEFARKGVDADFFEAQRRFEAAMARGSAKAALALGRLHRQVLTDVPVALARLQFQVALFERAIEMGCPDGFLFLAQAYENGWGVKASTGTAWRLVKEGAERGSPAAMTAWGTNLYFENRYERGEEALAKRLEAKALLEKALKGGYGAAGRELAVIFRTYEQDPGNAIRVLREGARLGDVDCLFELAGIYRRGEDGQPRDPAYADKIDALRRQIDVREMPKPISDFSQWLPPKPVLPYRVRMP